MLVSLNITSSTDRQGIPSLRFKPNDRGRHRCSFVISGFTLMEILVSSSILVFMVSFLCQMMDCIGRVWKSGEAQIEKSEDGRAIVEYISKELMAATLPAITTSTTSLQFVVNPSSITPEFRAQNGLSRDAVFWQAPLATDQRLGDIAEIGYFVKWDTKTKSGNPRASLCRFFVNPVIAASGTALVSDTNFLIYAAPSNWMSDSILDAVAPADEKSKYQGLFVENVIAFWVTCRDPNGNIITNAANGTPFENSFDSRLGYNYAESAGNRIMHLPAAIDVSFVMLDSNSANRVGPNQQAALAKLAVLTADANDFVIQAKHQIMSGDNTLAAILSGLRPCKTRVFLQNSK